MKRIGILSDTHGHLDEPIFRHFEACNEIWHAGDIGNLHTFEKLEKFKPLRAVFGNIDGHEIRQCCAELNRFTLEDADVLIKHIVGYPGRYDASMKDVLVQNPPKLLIAGHSHILKVMYDKKHQLLFINPGAAGISGFHKVRTLIRLSIEEGQFKDLEVIEIQK